MGRDGVGVVLSDDRVVRDERVDRQDDVVVVRHDRVARQLRVARHQCVRVVVRDERVCVVGHHSVGIVRLDLVVHLCSLQPVLVLFSIF